MTAKKSTAPSFFDVTVHLLLHLVVEFEIYGHNSIRYWMYRYMKTFKGYKRNRAHPEAASLTPL